VKIFKNRQGLSLLEIIISLLILSLVMYGMTSLFVASKGLVYHSSSRVLSMDVAKYFFEDSGLAVSADNYTANQNCLYDDAACSGNSTVTYNGITYNITYHTDNVTNSSGSNTTIRKVVINVTWDEPQ
jgi:prepilin-type N-terminal cleavage/methylation domain-containing protein